MARQRSLRPSFFTNEDLGACSPLARLLFAGMWCWADREGYLEDRPRRLRAEILPYDQADGEALVAELARAGFIERLEVAGTRVIRVVNFARYQDPHPRETPSRFAQGSPGVHLRPTLGEPKADLGVPLAPPSPASPSSPSCPSSPSSLPAPPTPQPQVSSLPGWLAGVQETLSVAFDRPLPVGRDPAAVIDSFTRRRDHLAASGYDAPEETIVGDCLQIAALSKTGPPGTLSFFVGWLNNATPSRQSRRP